MGQTLTAEPLDSTTAEPSAIEPSATETSIMDIANPFRFLQTGAPSLDTLLREHRVPKGAVVHLDFQASQWPTPFLFSLCKTALGRGERVIFLYVPTFAHLSEDEEANAALRSGSALEFEFEEALEAFDLAPFFNAAKPDDPAAALRYLTANTFSEFENTLNHLLGGVTTPDSTVTAPGVVVVSGLEQLFGHVRLFPWMDAAGDAVPLVRAASARLRSWLQDHAARLEAAGTTLYLSHSAEFDPDSNGTLFARGLRPLLYANCSHSLFLEKTEWTCDCGRCPWALPGLGGLPVTLYERDVLLGSTFVPVLDGESGFDGPFLDGNPGTGFPGLMAAFIEAI